MRNYSKVTFRILKPLSVLISITLISACARNPVTNNLDFDLVSESQEIAIGEKQYMGLRQQQQGDYVADPALTQYVRQVGQRLVAVSDRRLPYEFVIVNSSEFNAWALPGGKIGVNRGVLTRLECESELAAILAHEVVHAAASHGSSSMSKGMVLEAINMASALAIDDSEKLQWVQGVTSLGGNLMLLKYSRTHELEADQYGMKYMNRAGLDPKGMVKVQETMERLSQTQDSNWLETMVATHPPSKERVAKSREQLAKIGQQPVAGECERYQEATRNLKQNAFAYENYDAAVTAFEKDDLHQATVLINMAIGIEPQESLFYGMRARIALKNDKTDHALSDLDKAVSLNPDYWQHYLVRGAIHKSRGNSYNAINDFRKSVALSPTVEAYYSLGELSLANSQQSQAVDYFWEAWSQESQLGIKAGKIVARMDLEKNPDLYMDVSLYRDENKNIIIAVQNNAELPVEVLEVELLKMKNFRYESYKKYSVKDTIASGDSLALLTPVGPVKGIKLLKYKARIVAARVAE